MGPGPLHGVRVVQFDLLSRGRPNVVVDLKNPLGVETVLRLVDKADVFIEGFRPGVVERLGLGPDTLLARRPALVYGRMTGWGQDGPWAGRAGHDVTYLATTGLLHAIGPPERPVIPLNVVADFGGGALYLMVGILAALYDTRSSGQGQVVDAAIVDGAAHLATSIHALMSSGMWQDRREANPLDGGLPYYAIYETSDGGHLAVGALEPHFYAEFERLLDLPAPLPDREDPARWPDLRAAIAARVRERSRDEWAEVFDGSDACAAVVVGLAEASDHPHLAARGTVTTGPQGPVAAPAPRFSRTPTSSGSPPRAPGADTREALLLWGIDDVEDLLRRQVVVQAEQADTEREEHT
jgi:alpha-methylacyl-CoA racemase